MKIKKRHYKMALCARRTAWSSTVVYNETQELAWSRAVDSVRFWSLAAVRLKGYK